MSGLAGVVSLEDKSDNKRKIKILLDKISHRGEKRDIFNICGNFIGMNSDSSIKNRKDEDTCLLDGRIYNIDNLLEKYGIQKGLLLSTDAQKIHLLFNKIGKNIFRELKGSFALVISDKEGDIYLARDVMGIKPLYYSKNKDTLIFASELKSIIEFGKNIKEFPTGSYMKNFKSPRRIKKIDSDCYSLLDNSGTLELEDRLEDYLLKAVDRRISDSNLTFGVWLSGGLDSSIVAALLKEFKDKVYTFSVGFEDSPDLNSAREVSNYLGTEHMEYKLDTDELFSSIPKVIYCLESFDAPLVRSSLGNIVASKISSSVDVVFSGEGGDELFAGYNYFLEYDSSKTIQKELVNSINSLHNTALQRVDRSANAYNVNAKLPLLDDNLLNFVLRIPPKRKVKKDKKISKYILRKVGSRFLPNSIAWREKDKFWEGAGIVDTLGKKIDDMITDEEFEKGRKLPGNIRLRNKEEVYYYRIFKDYYEGIDINNILSLTQDFN